MIRGGNVTIFVTDIAKAVQFYHRVLGMKLLKRPGKHWASLSAGGGFLVGLHLRSANNPEPGTPGSTLLGLRCDSLTAEIERLERAGVRAERTGVDEVGKFAYFRDHDGNPFYLWSAKR